MSKLDDISKYIREKLSGYIGHENNDDLGSRLVGDLAKVIHEARQKFDDTWADPPKLGDVVEVRDASGIILEPDDLGKPLYDATTGALSFTFILPGNPLLVLATTGRDAGKLRVMSTWSGDVGWIHLDNLRPF